jgi:hypothetical protein
LEVLKGLAERTLQHGQPDNGGESGFFFFLLIMIISLALDSLLNTGD